MLPTLRILTIVMACFALAAPASAADPLLSGYSGPGGGDQAILGTEVLPAPGGPEGGSLQALARAPVPAVEAAPTEAPTARITAAPPLTPRPAQRREATGPPQAGAPGRGTERRPSGRREGERAANPTPLAAVTYPASSANAEALSLSTILGFLFAVAGLLGIALGTARLADRSVTSPGVSS